MNELLSLSEEQQAQYDACQSEINAMQDLLRQTDYTALKIAEGAEVTEEIQQMLTLRAEWRQKINTAQATIAELLSIQPETLSVTYQFLNTPTE